jgi:hypothetical protein
VNTKDPDPRSYFSLTPRRPQGWRCLWHHRDTHTHTHILCLSHDPRPVIEVVRKTYRLKDESVGPPTCYVGADTWQMRLESGELAWMMCPETYVKTAVTNLQKQLATDGYGALYARVPKPFRHEYRPEIYGLICYLRPVWPTITG